MFLVLLFRTLISSTNVFDMNKNWGASLELDKTNDEFLVELITKELAE